MPDPNEDPVVRTGRREAAIALSIFALALTYTVGYCSWYGYNRSFDELRFILGFPDWVFVGILVPWVVCGLAGGWLSCCYITDSPLEAAEPPPDGAEDDEGRGRA
jgi:hypothetical protein